MKGTMKSCSRYDITYLSLDTRYHTGVNSHITAQNRASLMLILELLFITEGVLNCPFLAADDTDTLVDFICISCCE